MIDAAPFLRFADADTWSPRFRFEQEKWLGEVLAPPANSAATVREPSALMLARGYVDTARRRDYIAANLELTAATQHLRRHDLNLSWTDEELCRWCERKAEKAVPYLRTAERSEDPATILAAVLDAQAIAQHYDIEPPSLEDKGPMGILRRLVDPKWWRGAVRRLQRREVEKLAILLRRVRKGREIYCADETVRRRSAQRWRNRKYLEATTAENLSADTDAGERSLYSLAELADLSVSNPRIRRGELMLRIRGFDEVAQLLGHTREFWTMTTPSRFHRWTTAGEQVRENPKWDGSTPRDAQDWLTDAWARIRAALGRRGIRLYGFRVVEAHHDGTPHWHLAMFYAPHWQRPVKWDEKGQPVEWEDDERRAAAPRVRAIVRRYLIAEEVQPRRKAISKARRIERERVKLSSRARKHGTWARQDHATAADRARAARTYRQYRDTLAAERAAWRELAPTLATLRRPLADARAHRCDFKEIDDAKGDAAGYLAKYITKAIDAEDAADLVQSDLYGYDLGESARRVEAWAACWGIRQFQQIGGPSVTAWRELRRAMGREVTQADLFDAPRTVQLAAEAADEADWQAFVLLMGGPCVKRDQQLVRLGYWYEHDGETGEVIGAGVNRYGEIPEARIYGLRYEQGDEERTLFTRVNTWTTHRPGEERPDLTATKAETFTRMREVELANVDQEWSPWAFDVLEELDAAGIGPGFRFSGGAAAPPLESCQ